MCVIVGLTTVDKLEVFLHKYHSMVNIHAAAQPRHAYIHIMDLYSALEIREFTMWWGSQAVL